MPPRMSLGSHLQPTAQVSVPPPGPGLAKQNSGQAGGYQPPPGCRVRRQCGQG